MYPVMDQVQLGLRVAFSRNKLSFPPSLAGRR